MEMPRSMARLLPILLLVLGLFACASSTVCHPEERTNCVQQGSGAEAVGTAILAGAAWTAVGCRVNGCNPGYVCNEATRMCEQIRCDEGLSCIEPFECNLEEGVCE